MVTPLGVLAAFYLREYAKQGTFVSTVRIAVNNLAGVPSIVFGVFGVGFFIYVVGGSIDRLFFAEALPTPTFGTGGILWASLTLALLTDPVVIVATEEGLAAIPGGMREASLALGATKLETTLRVVLPAVMPSILTGLILAMARAAGEVAPLMLTGVVKLAPALPIDGYWPFLHLDRKFMHLGFHIYDVGFQSPNVDAARPMVFVTTLLLLADRRAAEPLRDRDCATVCAGSTRPRRCREGPMAGNVSGAPRALTPRATAAAIMEMPMVEIDTLSLWYGEKLALKDISMSVPKHRVTAYIGPSGCGKSTLLRCLNRMNDLVDGVRTDRRHPHRRRRHPRPGARRRPSCASASGWSSRSRTRSRSRSSRTSPTGPRILGVSSRERPRRRSSSAASRPRRSGTRSTTASTTARSGSRAASSSASASPAPSPSSPRSC